MVQKAVNARERFESAALALFRERGYARTTVPDIAARAGLTERTFYRYFADKPEVLFWRAGEFETAMVEAIARAPTAAATIEALLAGFEAIGEVFDTTRADIAARHALVAAHPEFTARDLLKKQELTIAVSRALRARGMNEVEAHVASETGMTVWRIALDRWTWDDAGSSFVDHVRQAFEQIRRLADTGDRGCA